MANQETGTEKWNTGYVDGPAKVGETVSDLANLAKDKVSELGRAAAQKLGETQTGTADALHGSAASVRNAGQSSGESIKQFANTTAEKLESTAAYVRDVDFSSMMKDVTEVVRRNPTPSLIVAIAIGFLAGSSWRKRD